MQDFFEQNTISVAFALGFTGIFIFRTAYWKFAPRGRQCETCEQAGQAKRVVRGSYWLELPILAVGLSVGLFVHLILMFAILTFLWRTFGAYLVCANCGSERLLAVSQAHTHKPANE